MLLTDKQLQKKIAFAKIPPTFILAIELRELGYTSTTFKEQTDVRNPTNLDIMNYLRDFEIRFCSMVYIEWCKLLNKDAKALTRRSG